MNSTQWTKHLPLVLILDNREAVDSEIRSRNTTTIAKQQLDFKVEPMAAYDACGQRDVEEGEMHIKKLENEDGG